MATLEDSTSNHKKNGYLQEIDLRELAEFQEAERTCLSLYASSRESLNQLDQRAENIRELLHDSQDELVYFERNYNLMQGGCRRTGMRTRSVA